MTREQIAEAIMNVTGANSVGELKRINVPADGLLQILDRLLCEGERDECPSASIPIPPYPAPPPSPSPDATTNQIDGSVAVKNSFKAYAEGEDDHLRDATEKGGDRAREMAHVRVTALDGYVHLRDARDMIVVAIHCPNSPIHLRDEIRAWLADALRVYGDELLDKAAKAAARVAWRHSSTVVTDAVCALKSSATKGAANG